MATRYIPESGGPTIVREPGPIFVSGDPPSPRSTEPGPIFVSGPAYVPDEGPRIISQEQADAEAAARAAEQAARERAAQEAEEARLAAAERERLREQIRAEYAWIPPELFDAFVEGWADAETSDPGIAAAAGLRAMREHESYDTYFAGNRRNDGSGTVRYREDQYATIVEGYEDRLRSRGVNPDLYQSKFGQLIEGNVSVEEFDRRLNEVWNGVVNNVEQVRTFYSQYYGLDLTDEAILATALDPQGIGTDILERRVDVAQVAAEAQRGGFTILRQRAERLVNAGLDQSQARSLYTQAAFRLPTLNRLAERFDRADSDYGIEEFVDSEFLGGEEGAFQARRQQRLLDQHAAQFAGAAQFRRDRDGGLSGLRQR